MKKIAFLLAGLLVLTSWTSINNPGDLESACLSKFKNISLPFELGSDKNGITNTQGESLTSDMQEKILDVGGYNEEGFGFHATAIGKIELSKGVYALIYSELVVPVPAHMDEHSIGIYKSGSKKMEHLMKLAYTRGGPGIDEETMTCKIVRNGKNIEIHQTLKSRKAIETSDGPDYEKQKVFEIISTIDSKGNLKAGKKKEIK